MINGVEVIGYIGPYYWVKYIIIRIITCFCFMKNKVNGADKEYKGSKR